MSKKVKRSKKPKSTGYVLFFTGRITFRLNGKIIKMDGAGTFGEDIRITIKQPKDVSVKIGKNKLK